MSLAVARMIDSTCAGVIPGRWLMIERGQAGDMRTMAIDVP